MDNFKAYKARLTRALDQVSNEDVVGLAEELLRLKREKQTVFLCGNGGSGGNAIHIANDFIYGARGDDEAGLAVEALTSNSAVITCLGNDIGFENIFSYQLKAKAKTGDLLVVLSGSGNSKNIVNALIAAKERGVMTYAILGYDGGEAKKYADRVIHIRCDDMQICEDVQLIIGHVCMQIMASVNHG